MSNHIAMLQEQINNLYEGLHTLRAQIGQATQIGQPLPPIDPTLHTASYPASHGTLTTAQESQSTPTISMSPQTMRPKSNSQTQQPSFRGPTSNAFNFGVAKSSLETMGITSQGDGDVGGSGGAGSGTADATPDRSPARVDNGQLVQSVHGDKDPIWSIPQEEALRLCRVYEDEMGLMYPILDVEKVVAYATKLYRFMEAAHRTGLMQQGFPGADALDDEDTNLLKLVLATAMTVEGSGRSDLGQRMFEYVQPAIDQMLLGNVGVKAIRLLAMTVSSCSAHSRQQSNSSQGHV